MTTPLAPWQDEFEPNSDEYDTGPEEPRDRCECPYCDCTAVAPKGQTLCVSCCNGAHQG